MEGETNYYDTLSFFRDYESTHRNRICFVDCSSIPSIQQGWRVYLRSLIWLRCFFRNLSHCKMIGGRMRSMEAAFLD